MPATACRRAYDHRMRDLVCEEPAAAAIYRKLVDSYPGALDYQTGLGWALLRMGKREEAGKLFRSVLAPSPDNTNALQGLAAK